MTRPLSAASFAGDPVRIARGLLGGTLVRVMGDGPRLTGRIVEVEAYDCPRDPACTAGRFHAARSAAMAVAPGRWVFWTAHGHPLLQVSCRPAGVAASVLIRALEPLDGVDVMLTHRPVTRERDLTNGPAKLVVALGLGPARVTGLPVDSAELHVLPPERTLPDDRVEVTGRIGLRAGRTLPWRFVLRGNRWVSPAAPGMDRSPGTSGHDTPPGPGGRGRRGEDGFT